MFQRTNEVPVRELVDGLDLVCSQVANPIHYGDDGLSGCYPIDCERFHVRINRYGEGIHQVRGQLRSHNPEDRMHFAFDVWGDTLTLIEGEGVALAYINRLLDSETLVAEVA